MVVTSTQSKLGSAPYSLDLFLENFSIFSASEDLSVSDEEESKNPSRSPFDAWYVKDEGWPSCAHTRDTDDCFGDENSTEVSSELDMSSPTSPVNVPSHQKQGTWQSPLMIRESLLQEAWERKQELYLKQELVNLKERANVQVLGRSASDCGKTMGDICNLAKQGPLERSMSDCSKPKKDPSITLNRFGRTLTRSLTADDFEELKGCLDLGFRFDQSSIPDLCDTLPALEAVCAVTQNLQESASASLIQSWTPSPTPCWRITSPGDDPEEVREKLKHWAQAVACSARLCY